MGFFRIFPVSVALATIILSGCKTTSKEITTVNPNPVFVSLGSNADLGRVARPNGEKNPHGIPVSIPKNAPSIISDYKTIYNSDEKTLRPAQISPHTAIDITGPIGSPLLAPADGVVAAAFKDWGNGNMIIIDHGKDRHGNYVASTYSHTKDVLALKGQKVKRGEVVATLGKTGHWCCLVTHVHFGLSRSKAPINPYKWWQGRDNPHVAWFDGPGKVSCFDEKRDYSNNPAGFTYPIKCE